ncbi:hypothetical protein NIES4074_61710 (plasmid) [Cylindrospermum sp. NIES-4074]|nr:hypothetical protein NIES4074_61710 [Cylindrospermum sp. NIES-4074]
MNFDDLPQLEPLPLIPEQEEDKELFYPSWQCFCCQDSGIVQQHLARLIMPKYSWNNDKWPACQNCDAFNQRWGDAGLQNFDTRFNLKICQKLDLISRDDWQQTVQRQIDIRAIASASETIAKKMTMPGSSDRTANDEREVQQRKQEAEAYDWAAATTAYLGGGEDE